MNYLDTPFLVQLSFGQVIGDWEKAANGAGERAREARELLEEVALHPELREGLRDDQQIAENSGLIKRLMHDYFPPVLSNNEIKAISLPYRKDIFNHTNRFSSILAAAGPGFELNIRDFDTHQSYVLSCCIILNEFYGTHLDFFKPLFCDIPMENGIVKHYRILYNADYMDISPTDRALPISQEEIDRLVDNYDDLELWRTKFPKESWLLRGFSLMTLVDVTVENAVSIFKEKLLVLNADNFQQSVESIFRSIYRIADIRIGFTVFNRHRGVFKAANFGHRMKSFILRDDEESCDEEILCINSFQELIQGKEFFAISDTAEFQAANPDSQLAALLLAQDIQSFILAPVIKNNVLLGVLELVSPRVKELNSINANKLEVVMPFLTDSIDRLIGELENQIQAFIQEKYTTIHNSVYWKFKEEAESVLSKPKDAEPAELEEIVFPDVYPLYGQVDIKGSSEVRNSSVQNDLQHQLKTLLSVLKEISNLSEAESFLEEELQLKAFLQDLMLPLKTNTEQLIHNYVVNKIHRYLLQLRDENLKPVIDGYFAEDEKENGSFHIYRRKYETTIATINEKLAALIDSRQIEAQAIFPHYYERFKTDGVEHNLYLGASIAPRRKFEIQLLHQLRLWQIRVLCEMEKTHECLKSSLPYSLEVTTLILIYNTEIDIRFRMDEKRFDVDGSYNARFEIVKKRIDKAHIKDTQQRITEPGKITLVYAGDNEEDEYIKYIRILQSEGILQEGLELFEVEDLQGVSGLKALRAKIAR
ncbi:MAG: GAF domain-containing protein [Pedobacter sp.]|uniref:GAF domain-containing protein n=1 Tax=Pedobacter sp. TaxID=1411316 RepID=UPI00339A53FC